MERIPGSYKKYAHFKKHDASLSNVSDHSKKPPSSLMMSSAEVFRAQNRHIGRVNGKTQYRYRTTGIDDNG